MKEAFYTVDEEYRQKQYPRGYFAAIAKSGRQGGIALVILGLVILLMGAGLGFITIVIFMDSVKEGDTEGMVGPAVFMWIVALLFALGGILLIRMGIRRRKMGAEEWIQKSAKASGYPESVIRDFAEQAVESDCIRARLKTAQIECVLTRDYILYENLMDLCVMKMSDIAGVYWVSVSDMVNAGGKMKTVYTLSVGILSKKGTYQIIPAAQKNGEHLISLLMQRNPAIDRAEGKVLSESEFDRIKKGLAG